MTERIINFRTERVWREYEAECAKILQEVLLAVDPSKASRARNVMAVLVEESQELERRWAVKWQTPADIHVPSGLDTEAVRTASQAAADKLAQSLEPQLQQFFEACHQTTWRAFQRALCALYDVGHNETS